MVNAPTLAASTGSSMIELIAVVLLVAGVAFAVSALPAFRQKASEHAVQLRSIIDPNAPKPSPVTTGTGSSPATASGSTPSNESVSESIRRREIEDFDYSLFER
jgi:hypothetical protein